MIIVGTTHHYVGKCNCGQEVELLKSTNTCVCGREYNLAGQLLPSSTTEKKGEPK